MTIDGTERRWRALAAVAVCFLTICVAMSFIATEHVRALVFLAAQRPSPTGEHPVGVAAFRPVGGAQVELWYPAEGGCSGLVARAVLLLRMILWPTRAVACGAPPAPGSHPLILLLPSWFAERDVNTFMAANLASHGFVVAAADDFVHGSPLSGGDRIAQLGSLDMNSEAAFATSRAVSRQRAVLGARAASATIDAVIAHPLLGPRIDAARIGVLGYSFGGSIAAAMSRETGRLRAVINLDGDVIATEAWPPTVPYLFLTSDLPYPSAADLASDDRAFRFESITTRDTYDLHERPDFPRDSLALSVKQAVHADFSDRLVMPPFQDFLNPRPIDRVQMWRDINGLIVAFLSARLGTKDGSVTLPGALSGRFVKLPSP
ncbi:dienelactone hydrolase family protein [Methylobacterium sp. M6A4_1b]